MNLNISYMKWNISGRLVDGREITVQYAKYGPNARVNVSILQAYSIC